MIPIEFDEAEKAVVEKYLAIMAKQRDVLPSEAIEEEGEMTQSKTFDQKTVNQEGPY